MNASVVLGDEYDDALRARLMAVLKRLGAQVVGGPDTALAGSQEIEVLEVELDGRRLRVEAETYIGLSLSGPDDLVRRVQSLLVTHG